MSPTCPSTLGIEGGLVEDELVGLFSLGGDGAVFDDVGSGF